MIRINSLCKLSNIPNQNKTSDTKRFASVPPAQKRKILLDTTRSAVLSIKNYRNSNLYNIRSNNMYEELEVVPRIEYECKYGNEDRMVKTPVKGDD